MKRFFKDIICHFCCQGYLKCFIKNVDFVENLGMTQILFYLHYYEVIVKRLMRDSYLNVLNIIKYQQNLTENQS